MAAVIRTTAKNEQHRKGGHLRALCNGLGVECPRWFRKWTPEQKAAKQAAKQTEREKKQEEQKGCEPQTQQDSWSSSSWSVWKRGAAWNQPHNNSWWNSSRAPDGAPAPWSSEPPRSSEPPAAPGKVGTPPEDGADQALGGYEPQDAPFCAGEPDYVPPAYRSFVNVGGDSLTTALWLERVD